MVLGNQLLSGDSASLGFSSSAYSSTAPLSTDIPNSAAVAGATFTKYSSSSATSFAQAFSNKFEETGDTATANAVKFNTLNGQPRSSLDIGAVARDIVLNIQSVIWVAT